MKDGTKAFLATVGVVALVGLISWGIASEQEAKIRKAAELYRICLASGRSDLYCYKLTGYLPSEIREYEIREAEEDGTIKPTNIFNWAPVSE